jgi:hypothetical protein
MKVFFLLLTFLYASFLFGQVDSIICTKIAIEDVAIGYHDNYFTSANNYADAPQLAAYCIPGSIGGVNVNRALIRFDIPKILDTVEILSAKLNLFALGVFDGLSGHSVNNKNGVVLKRVTTPWKVDEVSWDTQPNSTNVDQIALSQPTSFDQNYHLDILNMLPSLQLNNNGLLLRQVDELPTITMAFCSSNFYESDRHPYVEICYRLKKATNEIEPASIGDFVWNDTNGDGIQNTGEVGIEGVFITLAGTANDGDALKLTNITDNAGFYLFENLKPGAYNLSFTTPAGFENTKINQGGNDAIDSDVDPKTGFTPIEILLSGEDNNSYDAGYYKPETLVDCEIELRPNPAVHDVFIYLNRDIVLKYKLYADNGQFISSGDLYYPFTKINAATLSDGVYYITVSNCQKILEFVFLRK